MKSITILGIVVFCLCISVICFFGLDITYYEDSENIPCYDFNDHLIIGLECESGNTSFVNDTIKNNLLILMCCFCLFIALFLTVVLFQVKR